MSRTRVIVVAVVIAISVLIGRSVNESMQERRQIVAMNGVKLWGRAIEEMWQAHDCGGQQRGPCPTYDHLPTDSGQLVTFARLSRERLPAFDPWGNAFHVSTRPETYSITSAGADGRFETKPRNGRTYSPDCDIIWVPDSFAQWSENRVEIPGLLPESAVIQVKRRVAFADECRPCHKGA